MIANTLAMKAANLLDQPLVSIVIPCRNERGYIGRCLASLEKASFDRERTTVLVCDGMSEDGTREEIDSFANRLPWVRRLENLERTTPYALNLGLQHQPFDVGIILGAHAEVAPDFVERDLAALREDPYAAVVGGIITNIYSDDLSRRIGLAMGHPFGVGGAHFRTGARHGYVDTVAFGAYRRGVFERVGWFNSALVRNQDDEFNYRVTNAGMRILLDPSIKSLYHVRASYQKLYRQYFQYGYWKVYVNKLHRSVTTMRQLVPAAWVLFVMLGGLLTLVFGILLPFYLTGVFIYVSVALFSAVGTKAIVRDVPGVLYAFAILHWAYGMGYWKGVLEFLVRGRGPDEMSQRSSR